MRWGAVWSTMSGQTYPVGWNTTSVRTQRCWEDKRGFCVSVGWPRLPCVLEVCSKVLPSEVEDYVSTDSEVLGGQEGVLCGRVLPVC